MKVRRDWDHWVLKLNLWRQMGIGVSSIDVQVSGVDCVDSGIRSMYVVLSGTSMIWGLSSHSGLSLAKQQVNFDNILWVTCANNEAHVDRFLLLWMLFCQHDNLRHCQSFRVTLFLSAKLSHAELFLTRSSGKQSRQFRPTWDLCQVWKNFFWSPSYMYVERWLLLPRSARPVSGYLC